MKNKTFEQRLQSLQARNNVVITFHKARYAKEKVVIRFNSDGMWKPWENLLFCEKFPTAKFVHRESGYVVSAALAEKFANILFEEKV